MVLLGSLGHGVCDLVALVHDEARADGWNTAPLVCEKQPASKQRQSSAAVFTVDTNPLRSEIHGHLPGHANDARLDRFIPYRIPSGEHAVDARTTKVSSVLRLRPNSPSANVAPGHVYDGPAAGGCHVWDGALAGAENGRDGDGELVLPGAEAARGG